MATRAIAYPAPAGGSTTTATFPAAASQATAPASAGLTATVTSVVPPDEPASEPFPGVSTLTTTASPVSARRLVPGQPALPLAGPLTA